MGGLDLSDDEPGPPTEELRESIRLSSYVA